jgi:hypothetical protein
VGAIKNIIEHWKIVTGTEQSLNNGKAQKEIREKVPFLGGGSGFFPSVSFRSRGVH